MKGRIEKLKYNIIHLIDQYTHKMQDGSDHINIYPFPTYPSFNLPINARGRGILTLTKESDNNRMSLVQ